MINQSERVIAVFEAAVLLEPAERLSFVREACTDDSDLRRQVESMLADVDQPVVVDRPVDEAIADLMDDDRPVVIGRQIGPYRVESLLGAGVIVLPFASIPAHAGRLSGGRSASRPSRSCRTEVAQHLVFGDRQSLDLQRHTAAPYMFTSHAMRLSGRLSLRVVLGNSRLQWQLR